MKATGIVRRIDDLGRIVVPKEIRRTLRIREGDPLEIFTDREGEIILKKYSPIGELSQFAGEYAESLAQDCMSLDKRPYIGPYSKNTPDLFVATGFGKWGMTGSMLSAMILSDLIQEKNNEYSTVFSPSRNMLKPQLISNLGHALVGIGRVGGKRCSHMGCVLQWNKEEQTWECPCHGSRFSADGKVLDNPACDGLKKKHKK